MADVETALREGYKTALTGITYASVTIPIVDEKVETANADLYIALAEQSRTFSPNKSYNAWLIDMNVRIVNRRLSSIDKEVIENVGEQVILRIVASAVSIDAPYKITYIRELRTDTSVQQIEAETYQQIKLYVFTNRIIQN